MCIDNGLAVGANVKHDNSLTILGSIRWISLASNILDDCRGQKGRVIVAEDVVDVGMVVFTRIGILDEGEEWAEVGRMCQFFRRCFGVLDIIIMGDLEDMLVDSCGIIDKQLSSPSTFSSMSCSGLSWLKRFDDTSSSSSDV